MKSLINGLDSLGNKHPWNKMVERQNMNETIKKAAIATEDLSSQLSSALLELDTTNKESSSSILSSVKEINIQNEDKHKPYNLSKNYLDPNNKFSYQLVSAFLDKISDKNHLIKSVADLLLKDPSKWKHALYKYDKEILLHRINEDEFSILRLLRSIPYLDLLELEKQLPKALEFSKKAYLEEKQNKNMIIRQEKISKVDEIINNLRNIGMYSNKEVAEMKEKLISKINEQTGYIESSNESESINKSKRYKKDIGKYESIEYAVVSNQEISPYARDFDTDNSVKMTKAEFKIIINGEIWYFSNSKKSTIYKLVTEYYKEELEKFRNKDSIPEYFHSTYQAQKMYLTGLSALIKEKINESCHKYER